MLKKNDIITLTITDLTAEAMGVGRYEGMAVFVPLSAVGDQLRVRIVKVQKTLCYGIIEEILSPSPARTEPLCPVYGKCGGCSLRHISYEEECRHKQHLVYENMRRIGGISVPETPVCPLASGGPLPQQGPVSAGADAGRRSGRVLCQPVPSGHPL